MRSRPTMSWSWAADPPAPPQRSVLPQGRSVLLLDRAGRIKPCGGAIPPRARCATSTSPTVARRPGVGRAHVLAERARGRHARSTDGFVGMVDREHFDEWLRRARRAAGANAAMPHFETLTRDADGTAIVNYAHQGQRQGRDDGAGPRKSVIGADGALSLVARQDQCQTPIVSPYVFAYHEIIRSAASRRRRRYDATRCDVYLSGRLLARFLRLDLPARRHGQRRHRLRQ